MCEATHVGQNVHGTDGTHPQDAWDASTGWLQSKRGGVLPKVIVLIVFPRYYSKVQGGPEL